MLQSDAADDSDDHVAIVNLIVRLEQRILKYFSFYTQKCVIDCVCVCAASFLMLFVPCDMLLAAG